MDQHGRARGDEAGPGRTGSCEPGVRKLSLVLPSGYKPGRNVDSKGVSSVDRRQEAQSVPSDTIYLSRPGFPPPP